MSNKDNLPEGWEWVQLRDVCIIIAGQSPKSDTYNTEKIGLPFYQGKMDFGIEFPTPRIWCSAPIKIAINDDILLSVRAPVGPTNRANENCCIGRGLCAIRANSDIDKSYLKAYFRMFESDIAKMGRGSIFQAITTEDVKDLTIPLPPLDEQRRIAAIIDKELVSVEKLKKAAAEQQEAAEALAEAYLREVFEFDELPEGWEWKRLGDVCETTSGGTPLSSNKAFYENGTIPWLVSGEVNQGIITKSQKFITRLGLQNSSAKMIPENSVLIAMYGATAGQVALLKPEAATNQAICAILPNKNIDSVYLFYVMKYQKNELVKKSTGGAQPNISQTLIQDLTIPLPPLPEQRRIADIIGKKLASVEKLKTHLAEQAETINALSAAILRKAFTGDM
jgi:type I restriction enzyme S subunit